MGKRAPVHELNECGNDNSRNCHPLQVAESSVGNATADVSGSEVYGSKTSIGDYPLGERIAVEYDHA